MIARLDACPVCPPGIPDASPALGAPRQVPGGTVTDHQCGMCETAWSTFWRDGWPVDRLIAPVAAADAELHRDMLTLARVPAHGAYLTSEQELTEDLLDIITGKESPS